MPTPAIAVPRRALTTWLGRIVFGLPVLFLAFDASMKMIASPEAIDGTVQLGYPAGVLQPLGILQLVCLVVLLVPRTAPLGAVLWTGYFGGAIATHVRVQNPLATHILFPVYIAALLWLGLWIRDERVRNMFRRR